MTDCKHPHYDIVWIDEKLMCLNCDQEFVPKEEKCDHEFPIEEHGGIPIFSTDECTKCGAKRTIRYQWSGVFPKPEAGEGKANRFTVFETDEAEFRKALLDVLLKLHDGMDPGLQEVTRDKINRIHDRFLS